MENIANANSLAEPPAESSNEAETQTEVQAASSSTAPRARTAVSGFAAADAGGSAPPGGQGGKKKKKVSDQTGEDVAKRMMNGPFSDLSRHVASLPKQVSTAIEKNCSSMLALVNEIDTKTTALAPFGKMVTVAKTGERVLYAPVCSREAKNPLSGSNRIKETEKYKTIVSDYDELLRDFTIKSTNLIHESAKLEVTERKRLLREEVVRAAIDLAVNLAETVTIKCKFKDPELYNTLTLTAESIGWNVAILYLNQLPESTLKLLFFESSAELSSTIQLIFDREGGDVSDKDAMENAGNLDKRVQRTITPGLEELFPLMTWEAWNTIKDEQAIIAVNAHLAVKKANKAQSKINKETEGTITDKVALDKETVFDLIDEYQAKKDRKKSSGGFKNQKSPGTKNGPVESKRSNKPKGKSQAKPPPKQPTKQATEPSPKLSRKQRKAAAKAKREEEKKCQEKKPQKKSQQPRKRGRGNRDEAASAKSKKRRQSKK